MVVHAIVRLWGFYFNMFIERIEIAKKLGISGKALNRIAYYGKLEYKTINNKRHYDFDEVIEIIKKAKNE